MHRGLKDITEGSEEMKVPRRVTRTRHAGDEAGICTTTRLISRSEGLDTRSLDTNTAAEETISH
jgi:hypothetical protein